MNITTPPMLTTATRGGILFQYEEVNVFKNLDPMGTPIIFDLNNHQYPQAILYFLPLFTLIFR
jgi:hypothetical protein